MTNSPMFDTMSTMRAMRRLKPDPVPEELLTQLIRAATSAPSGSNIQGYQYVVVTNRAKMANLGHKGSRCNAHHVASHVRVRIQEDLGNSPAGEDLCGHPVGWPVGRFGPVGRLEPEDVVHRDGW